MCRHCNYNKHSIAFQLIAAGRDISSGYMFPRKQGIDDARFLAGRRMTATNVSLSRKTKRAAHSGVAQAELQGLPEVLEAYAWL